MPASRILRSVGDSCASAALMPATHSNATTSLIAPALIAMAARYGIALDCVEADFGQVLQEAVSADSAALYRDLPVLTAAPAYPTRLVGVFDESTVRAKSLDHSRAYGDLIDREPA